MSIKTQVLKEIELHKKLRGKDKKSLKTIANEAGINYSGFLLWINNPGRGINDKTLDKIADVLGKRIILIDNTI